MSADATAAFRAILSAVPDDRPGITLTRDQLEAWVNRPMTDEEVGWLEDSIPNSSIPDSIVTIVEANAD